MLACGRVFVSLQHIQKLLHQKDLETQLLEAKLAQCQLMIEKEQEKGGAEKQMVSELCVSLSSRSWG